MGLVPEEILMRWSVALAVWCLAGLCILAAVIMAVPETTESRSAGLLISKPMPISSLARIELQQGDEQVVFEKRMDGWWQTSPFLHPMRADFLMSLPQQAMQLKQEDMLDVAAADISRESLGLEPPRATLRLIGDEQVDGRVIELRLGRRGLGGRAWADLGGEDDHVRIVQADLHALLDAETPQMWRDLQLFPGLSIDAQMIQRDVSGETMTLSRKGAQWHITEPLRTRADGEAVGRHLSELGMARGVAVLVDEPVDLSAFGLSPPVAEVVVKLDSGVRRVFVGERLGGALQDRYVMVEGVPSVMRLAPEDVVRLLGNPTVLVDHTGTGVSPMDVKSLRIQTGDEEFVLERRLDRWYAVGHGEVAPDVVDLLIKTLTNTRADMVSLLDVYPEEWEVGMVTMLDAAGGPLDTVRILRSPGTGDMPAQWALENGDRVLRMMSPELEIPFQPMDFGLSGTP